VKKGRIIGKIRSFQLSQCNQQGLRGKERKACSAELEAQGRRENPTPHPSATADREERYLLLPYPVDLAIGEEKERRGGEKSQEKRKKCLQGGD